MAKMCVFLAIGSFGPRFRWPSAHRKDDTVYGYDRSATLDDAATLNDTTLNDKTRNDATHDDFPTPTMTTRPTLNVNADWRA